MAQEGRDSSGAAPPAITVLTAAGKASFTDEQVDRLERAGDTTFHKVAEPVAPDMLAELLAGATVAGLTPRRRAAALAAGVGAPVG